ncbi:MAG: leucine-rich repeat domain-containing protein [Asgard group archaeon]|nr:leucine-rich repeat domain-containing protein [Asgard group archaeon]
MKSDDEIVKGLLLSLRRDFKINEDVIASFNKIGSKAIPFLIDSFKIDDFAFQLKIIEILGRMGAVGSLGLIELLNLANLKTRTTILKTIAEMDERVKEASNLLIDKMISILGQEYLPFTNEEDFANTIDLLFSYRDRFVKTLLSFTNISRNMEFIEDITYLVFYLYLRKITTPEIKTDLLSIILKLKENKEIFSKEIKLLFTKVFQIDYQVPKILTFNIEKITCKCERNITSRIIPIVEEYLSQDLLKNCKRGFFLSNYHSNEINTIANYSFFLEMLLLFTDEQFALLSSIRDFEAVKKSITSMQQDLASDLRNVEYTFDTIDNILELKTKIKQEVKRIDVSGQKLHKVDLQLLKSCVKLRELFLRDTQLTEINLEPLQNYPDLETLDLAFNKLSKINLDPLKSCSRLKWLNLSGNQLSTIDLTPLQNNLNLIELNLNDNKIKIIDLSPLETCQNLEFLELDDDIELIWNKLSIPEESSLPQGLRDYYPDIKLAK